MEEKDDFWANVESEQDKSIPSMMISDNQASEPVMITGTPQQLSGTQHQMIMMQQPSSAPNVIGIFVIIFFLFFSKYFISMGQTGVMEPWLAAWSLNFLFTPVAWLFYRFAQK